MTLCSIIIFRNGIEEIHLNRSNVFSFICDIKSIDRHTLTQLFSSFIELISLSMPEFSNWLKVIYFMICFCVCSNRITAHSMGDIHVLVNILRGKKTHSRTFHTKFDSVDKPRMEIGGSDRKESRFVQQTLWSMRGDHWIKLYIYGLWRS